MKKKAIVLALILLLVAVFSGSAYQTAIGGEFALRIGDGLPNSALLSFRLPKIPPVFGLGLTMGEGDSRLVLLADWWMLQGNLFSFVNYYVGLGGFVTISDGALLGARVPVGLNAYPLKPLEIFIELAPAFYLLNAGETINVDIPSIGVQAGFGFRFWF